MPLPIILGIAAAAAGVGGIGLGVNGGVKMKKANDKLKEAKNRNEFNNNQLNTANQSCCVAMDVLGKNELETLASFKEFSLLFEKIHNKPEFAEIKLGDLNIPSFKTEEINKVSVGASVLVGGLGGAALGTAGGFAASGAATSAVMALGTASTGTAISSLYGAALTNATLAALGGGSLAAGGGGVALGTTILGATTLGVGLLVGGVIFSITGSKISGKADEAWKQMLDNEKKIQKICNYLSTLEKTAQKYNNTLSKLRGLYKQYMARFRSIVTKHEIDSKVDWNLLSKKEQMVIENTVLLVGLLYNMCKVKLVKKSSSSNNANAINHAAINKAESEALNAYEKLSVKVSIQIEYFTKWGEQLYLKSRGTRYRMFYDNNKWHIRFDNIPEGLLNNYYYSVRYDGADVRVEKRHHRRILDEDVHEFNFVDSWHN